MILIAESGCGVVKLHDHLGNAGLTASLSAFLASKDGDTDADIETASPVRGDAPGTGRPAPGAEGPDPCDPYLLAICQSLAAVDSQNLVQDPAQAQDVGSTQGADRPPFLVCMGPMTAICSGNAEIESVQ